MDWSWGLHPILFPPKYCWSNNIFIWAVREALCIFDHRNTVCFIDRWTKGQMNWCLRNQLHDVPIAAVQWALSRCPVLGFVFWSHCVDDEPCCQAETLGQLCLPCTASCTHTHTCTKSSYGYKSTFQSWSNECIILRHSIFQRNIPLLQIYP